MWRSRRRGKPHPPAPSPLRWRGGAGVRSPLSTAVGRGRGWGLPDQPGARLMIPVRLAVRNFMSYTDIHEPLVFEGIHVACLSGENGAGKSTLLDAITWALWGYSRAGAGSAQQLVHAGRTEMEVEYEFRL